MEDDEIAEFLSELRNELRETRFSDFAEPDEFRDGEEISSEDVTWRARKEAVETLKAFKTQLSLYHRGTVSTSLEQLNESLDGRRIEGAEVVRERPGAGEGSSLEGAETLELLELPDLSGVLSEISELIKLVMEPPAEKLR